MEVLYMVKPPSPHNYMSSQSRTLKIRQAISDGFRGAAKPIFSRSDGRRTQTSASRSVPVHLCLRRVHLHAVRAAHLPPGRHLAVRLVTAHAALRLEVGVEASSADPAQAEVHIPHVLLQALNLPRCQSRRW
jgi:hypothetical protein